MFPHARSADDQAELEEERRLCYVAITRAQRRLVLTSAARRRVFGEYHSTEPSRFINEIPPDLIELAPSPLFAAPRSSYFRPSQAKKYPGGAREEADYSYADEDQSMPAGLRPGIKVRHPQFGLGTVLSVEQFDDDAKLLVRFNTVGQKTLRARFAKLEMVGER